MNVNRTTDGMQWCHTTFGLLTTCVCTCIITGIIAAIFFGGPSLPPGNASTSSEASRPAINSVSNEERQFIEGWKTKKICNSPKENLQGIRSVKVIVYLNDDLTKDKDTFIHTVQPDIELRLRQAGIKVVESPPPTADAVLTVQVLALWTPEGTMCSWCTLTDVAEWTHVIRYGQHYELMSTIWNATTINRAGSSHVNGFTQVITSHITRFLNDYLAANQP